VPRCLRIRVEVVIQENVACSLVHKVYSLVNSVPLWRRSVVKNGMHSSLLVTMCVVCQVEHLFWTAIIVSFKEVVPCCRAGVTGLTLSANGHSAMDSPDDVKPSFGSALFFPPGFDQSSGLQQV
jgi:hypothetical protein